MSALGVFVMLFPLLAFLADAALLVAFVVDPSWQLGLAFLATVYLLPLLTFRLVSLFRPLRPGKFDLSAPVYSPWWGAHRLQLLYGMFPALEMPFTLVPPLYRAWLRAWGSKIGKNVYFAPNFRPIDRGLFRIGDNVIFGDAASGTGHLIDRRDGVLSLYVDFITIEDDAFIGAGAQLAPGSHVEKGARVGAHAKIGPKARVAAGEVVPPNVVFLRTAPAPRDAKAS